MNDVGANFGHDTDKITIQQKDYSTINFPVKHTIEVACNIVMEMDETTKAIRFAANT
jgi:hypothetical protein